MSRGGAERRRGATQGQQPTTSSRVTAPRPAGPARKVNWWVLALIVLVLVGLVGGFFVSLASGTDPTSTVPTVAPTGG